MRQRPRMIARMMEVQGQSSVDAMKGRIQRRQLLETVADGGVWVLREEYEPVFGPKHRAMMRPEASEMKQPVDDKPFGVVRPRKSNSFQVELRARNAG